jgi:dTMP kinase
MSAAGKPGGLFITLEGPEGSGKSTQAERLSASLTELGFTVYSTREPGGTTLGDELRQLLLRRDDLQITAWAEALLFSAARAQLVRDVIRPQLERVDVVICDRFSDSTLAYQGWGRGLDRELLARLQEAATQGLMPDLTLLLDLPAGEGLKRVTRDKRDRLDRETVAFHSRVRSGYRALAEAQPGRWRRVDAAREASVVADEILAHCRSALAAAGRRASARRSA